MNINNRHGGYSYSCSEEQIREFKKLSLRQRLKWVDDINKFLFRFMPPQSRRIREEFRRGEK